MADVRFTNNPLEYTNLDGVIVTEKSPVPSIIRRGANNVIFIGQFERGPKDSPQRFSSISEIQDLYGNNPAYSGQKALRLKAWSNLYIIRAVANDAVKATITQTVATKDLITLTAKYAGVYGNGITAVITDGTNANTKKITISEGDYVEVFDNLVINGKTDPELAEMFRTSTLVDVTGSHVTDNIENATLELATGSDGSIASSDYQSALENGNVNASGKIYVADDNSAAVKSVLANYIKTNKSGICCLAPVSLDASVADAVAEADTLLDQEGRVLYAYNPIKYNVQGVIEEESPSLLLASILSLTPPSVSPAAAENRNYTQTAVGTKFALTDAKVLQLKQSGIIAFEDDEDLGVRVRTPVTGNEQFSITRRRMSDFLIGTLARYLKNYQNQPNSFINRASIRAAVIAFDEGLIADGILPTEADAGVPVLQIQTEGTTTPTEQAQGIQKIVYKRRIFAEMRFIVLETTIGEGVTVENVGA